MLPRERGSSGATGFIAKISPPGKRLEGGLRSGGRRRSRDGRGGGGGGGGGSVGQIVGGNYRMLGKMKRAVGALAGGVGNLAVEKVGRGVFAVIHMKCQTIDVVEMEEIVF